MAIIKIEPNIVGAYSLTRRAHLGHKKSSGMTKNSSDNVSLRRLRITIRGAVQGVGFRPFVFRLAKELSLLGWVINNSHGVFIEVEGQKKTLDQFLLRLQQEKPPRAFIQSMEFSFLDLIGYEGFEIRPSDESSSKTALILPDIATCPDCLEEIFEPTNRRFHYPFTNCTNCGPRFSIIRSLPYDRPNTSMASFLMCSECQREYNDPNDRRFHAQPNACPTCGPQLELWNSEGSIVAREHDALLETVQAILAGQILAIKGLGGFHLVVVAGNPAAVRRLRARKHREEKPFALMYPSLDKIISDCFISPFEERLLLSPEAPIVLLKNRDGARVSTDPIAPHNPYLGIMLPYTPLHHILLKELGSPIVATSGNLSDEPICFDEKDALRRLKGIADLFLIHNRPIVRHVDDSIVRVVMDRELVLRRARGYAPLPIHIEHDSGEPVLALGAHLKNTIALAVGRNVFVSQHIGDLETKESLDAFHSVISDFKEMYEADIRRVVCDLHPEYLSTKSAHRMNIAVDQIQHHYAHIVSCMAENDISPPVLGISWDGTGYGTDDMIWGGEFLVVNDASFTRAATFRPFRLPGSEKAIREPRRTCLALLYELFGADIPYPIVSQAFSSKEIKILLQMLKRGINSPYTTSVGRLFDAVASLTGLRHISNFEGQAAMELEYAITDERISDTYEFNLIDTTSSTQNFISEKDPQSIPAGVRYIIDWAPMIHGILRDVNDDLPVGVVAVKFHNTLSEIAVKVASYLGIEKVALSGGCFQNKYLTERTVQLLTSAGFRPYWHQRIPPNDGGISLGQIVAVALSEQKKEVLRESPYRTTIHH